MLKTWQSIFLPVQREWIYFIVFELYNGSWDLHAVFVLKDCLVGAVKLTKISFLDMYYCSGYGIGLDSCSLFFQFQILDGVKNAISFGVNNSSSVHINKKNIS